MAELNKLENLLEEIVKGYGVHDDGTTLSFIKGNHDVLIILSRKEDLNYAFLDCIIDHDYQNKFEFDVPMQYIDNFIRKHLWNSEEETNHLLKYSKIPPRKALDEYYEEFLKAIDNHPKFYPVFLPAVVSKDMPINEDNQKSKRPKI